MSSILHRGSRAFSDIQGITRILALRRRALKTKPTSDKIRLTVTQFGDYAEGYWRLSNGGAENYYAQRYSVDFMSALAARTDVESITIISLASAAKSEKLPNGIYTVGLNLYPVGGGNPKIDELLELVISSRPNHLVVMSPITQLICWGIQSGIATMPMFADSFRSSDVISRIRAHILALTLNHPSIKVVANHGLAAAKELTRIGVKPDKVIPFDWPAVVSPRDFEAKSAPPTDRPFRLVYVGQIAEAKGIGDAIRAIARLKERGRDVRLAVVGRGDVEKFRTLAAHEQISERVEFVGPKSHAEVLETMHRCDAVVVPSRWACPEGLPMTLYEALCSRSPLIASDHPMFALKIQEGKNALVFEQCNPDRLAARVEDLLNNGALYEHLSTSAEAEADSYLCPLKYDHVISDFISPGEGSQLADYSLARYSYFR